MKVRDSLLASILGGLFFLYGSGMVINLIVGVKIWGFPKMMVFPLKMISTLGGEMGVLYRHLRKHLKRRIDPSVFHGT